MSSESEEDDTVNFIDTSNEDDSISEVETERSRIRTRTPINRPLDISRNTEITPVQIVFAEKEGGQNAIEKSQHGCKRWALYLLIRFD